MNPEGIAALYGRTSKETDDAYSVDSQIDAGQSFAQTKQLTVLEGYAFREDYTGKALNRPKLDKLMKLVREKKVTSVIIYAVDRLARKIGVADMLLDEFMENGVRLWIVSWNSYVRDIPEDRMRFNIESTFSDYERRKIMERTTRGKKDKVRQGIYLGAGKPPYGYRKVGEKKELRLEVIEEQAVVIRQIFQWYAVERVATAEIMRRLNGIPTPSECEGVRNFPHKRRPKGDWSDATVYIILKTTAYAGVMKNFGSTVAVPAIIDPAVFDLAKQRLSVGRLEAFRNQRYEYLMGRRLKCKFCDYSIQGHPHGANGVVDILYYRCPSWRTKLAKTQCALPGFRVDAVDGAVWEWVRNLILHPESLRTMLEDSQKELQERSHDLKYRLTRVEERLIQEEKRLAVILREYMDNEARADTNPGAAAFRHVYRQAKEQAEQLFTALTEERDTLRSELTFSTIDNEFIDELTTFATEVRDDIDNLPFAGRRELIEHMGIYGELASENKERVVYIVWHTHTFRKVLTVSRSS